MNNRSLHLVALFALVILASLLLDSGRLSRLTGTPPTPTASARPLARLEPASGAYVGVSLDWGHDSADAFNRRLGRRAAVYVRYLQLPLQAEDSRQLDDLMQQVATERGAALLALEPFAGLAAITPAVADELAERLAGYNRTGVPVFVRFGHEMNGSWYPWGQQPTAYIAAFRRLATAIHQRAPTTAMLWTPNYGGGYPFVGGQYAIRPDQPDFRLLDTNRDGRLDMYDDMYAPYYPGDDAVDWVGLNDYHWGNQYPWGANELPEAGKLIAHLTGRYQGLGGDQRMLPDFYQVYAVARQKPLAIAETGALFNPARGGENELAIKQAWWRQLFNAQLARDYPAIKMINWFEWRKLEPEVGVEIDWTVTFNPAMVAALRHDLADPYWLFAPADG